MSSKNNKMNSKKLFIIYVNKYNRFFQQKIINNKMNSKKYIIVSSSCEKHWAWCSTLGHEIFFTRKIVLILLLNNLINNHEYIIVTSKDDRKFLYSKIFNNVLTFDQFRMNNVSSCNVIDICPYLLSLSAADKTFLDAIGAPDGLTMRCLKNLGLDKERLLSNEIFQNCNTETLNSLSCKMDFVDLNNTLFENVIKSVFFVIHIKSGTKYLNYIYNIIDTFGINSVIFTQVRGIPEKYLQTSNLQVYASLLNNSNCVFFITDWSGGGQLSQLCCKSTVLYYFDCYPQIYYNDKEQWYREGNDKDFYNAWDHYTPVKCKRIFLKKDEFENIHLLKQLCLP